MSVPMDWKPERAVQAKVRDLKKKRGQWLWKHGFFEGTWFQFRNGDFRQPSTYGLHSANGLILVLHAISGSFGWTSPHPYFIRLSFNFRLVFWFWRAVSRSALSTHFLQWYLLRSLLSVYDTTSGHFLLWPVQPCPHSLLFLLSYKPHIFMHSFIHAYVARI